MAGYPPPRPRSGVAMTAPVFQRPRPTREAVTLERLHKDIRLQQRAIRDESGQPAVTDPARVAELRERIQLGEEMPPEAIGVVREVKSGRVIDWLFRGFHTVEALAAEGVATALAMVYPGTFADAEFYSLSENSRGERPRGIEDCRKAFAKLVDSPELLRRVYEAGEKHGGTLRALAAACGLGKSTVENYLAMRGLHVSRSGRVLPADEPDPETVAKQEQAAALIEGGMTQREAAQELGVPLGTFTRMLKQPDVPPRPCGQSGTDEIQNDDEASDDCSTPFDVAVSDPAPRGPVPGRVEQLREHFGAIQAALRSIERHARAAVELAGPHVRAGFAQCGYGLAADGVPAAVAEISGGYVTAALLLTENPECAPPVDAGQCSPFADLAGRTTALATAFTRRLKGDDPDTAKLRDYLSACGLIDHHTAAKVEGEEYIEARCKFLPLAGVSAVLDLAALPGPAKPAKEVKAVYDKASGGFVPPIVARRRRERGSR